MSESSKRDELVLALVGGKVVSVEDGKVKPVDVSALPKVHLETFGALGSSFARLRLHAVEQGEGFKILDMKDSVLLKSTGVEVEEMRQILNKARSDFAQGPEGAALVDRFLVESGKAREATGALMEKAEGLPARAAASQRDGYAVLDQGGYIMVKRSMDEASRRPEVSGRYSTIGGAAPALQQVSMKMIRSIESQAEPHKQIEPGRGIGLRVSEAISKVQGKGLTGLRFEKPAVEVFHNLHRGAYESAPERHKVETLDRKRLLPRPMTGIFAQADRMGAPSRRGAFPLGKPLQQPSNDVLVVQLRQKAAMSR